MSRYTRAMRAAELLKRVRTGPSLSLNSYPGMDSAQRREIEALMLRQVKIWLETWVVSEVICLVPELGKPK